jgi:hypothetical protein
MAKSRHSKWMTIVNGNYRVFRKSNNQKGLAGKYDVLEFERYPYTPYQLDEVSKLVRSNLTDDLLSKKIKKKYPDNHLRWKCPFFGHCVSATFVLLYLMDTETLEPMRGEDSEGEGHWWLRDNFSQERCDLTFDQFATNEERESVYETGKPRGYYGFGEMPASRFFDLIQKVQPNSRRLKTDLLSIYKDFGFKTKVKTMEKKRFK